MNHEPVSPTVGFLPDKDSRDGFWQSHHPLPGYTGHSHFWERALSRRNFVQVAGGASGLLLASKVFSPTLVRASGSAAPKPLPGGTHLPFLPVSGPNSMFIFLFTVTGLYTFVLSNLHG